MPAGVCKALESAGGVSMLGTAKLCLVMLLVAVAGAAQAVTGMRLISSPGDYIGQGQTLTFRAPQATFYGYGQTSHVSVSVGEGGSNWTLDFAAATTAALTPASYPAAARYPFNS